MSWHFDPSGVVHHKFDGRGMVGDAIRDALKTQHQHWMSQPPMWFWWNGTFCPMDPIKGEMFGLELDAAAEVLYQRWHEWREAYQSGNLLDRIANFCAPRADQSSTDASRP
jgi:hypothetical protein